MLLTPFSGASGSSRRGHHILVDEVASVAAEVSALLLKPIHSPFSAPSLFFLSRRRPDLLGVIGQDESR